MRLLMDKRYNPLLDFEKKHGDFGSIRILVANNQIANNGERMMVIKMSVSSGIPIAFREMKTAVEMIHQYGKDDDLVVIVGNEEDRKAIQELLE